MSKKKQVLCWFFVVTQTLHAMEKLEILSEGKNIEYKHPTFNEWKETCLNLPVSPKKCQKPAISLKLLQDQLTKTIQQRTSQLNTESWLNEKKPPFEEPQLFFPPDFYAFTQKKLFLPDDKIAFKGDIHGGIHSLIDFLDTFKEYFNEHDQFIIQNPNFYMVFLGDYVDRGKYGVEVLYTITRLWSANPQQIFLVRGNHEDYLINNEYGFGHEFAKKYGSKKKSGTCYSSVFTFYNLLPLAFYLMCKTYVLQCCHGGIELGYYPFTFLTSTSTYEHIRNFMSRSKTFETIFKTTTLEKKDEFKNILFEYHRGMFPGTTNGFMWNDFICDQKKPFDSSGSVHERLKFGKEPTKMILQFFSLKPKETQQSKYQLMAIFRAHQHGKFDDKNPEKSPHMDRRILNVDQLSHPDDTGVGKLWIEDKNEHQEQPGSLEGVLVVTFAVSPEIGYNYPRNYFGLLTLAPEYKDWRLKALSTARRMPPEFQPTVTLLSEI